MSNLDDLRAVIHKLHGVHSTHVESVPVMEIFQGETIWDGVVEVFRLHGHPKAEHVYAWSHDTDDAANPQRHVTVLHVHPATSPLAAVRTALLQEYRDAQTA